MFTACRRKEDEKEGTIEERRRGGEKQGKKNKVTCTKRWREEKR